MRIDIPTAVSKAETRFLQRHAEGKRVMEAGALLGYSTVALSRVARTVISVDRHEGYSGDTWRRYRTNLARFGADNVVPIRANVLDLFLRFDHYDLAFFDLTGEYGLTMDVLKLTKSPIALVHDCGRRYCPGVSAAIRDARWKIVEGVDTLVLCERATGDFKGGFSPLV